MKGTAPLRILPAPPPRVQRSSYQHKRNVCVGALSLPDSADKQCRDQVKQTNSAKVYQTPQKEARKVPVTVLAGRKVQEPQLKESENYIYQLIWIT
ncbi:hypothetical protein AOXY_G3709 [Acipenser oxyrinchus oxyrinchus]|uniref:Uncharacterized protein n=1 Tax=Acipenser oxyrinchus oxyrinchus TaxID=40147 RepID=A0AAD8LTI1_ACIOX|nr:hypothetical protein AOXY_G3709 [Acipenser oxyrinchus oxyrinchus]